MPRLSAFETYTLYLALKRHFTSSYDFFRYGGKTKASLESFKAKRDQYNFQKLSRKYSDVEMKDFLVANFITNPAFWSGTLLSPEAEANYTAYLKRRQSLSHFFSEELQSLGDLRFKFIGDPPEIINIYLGGRISLETMILLDTVIHFKEKYDVTLKDDFLWPTISMLMEKFKPFLEYDPKKITQILKDYQKEHLNTA